ncbi:MAG: hypothetical protein NT154_08010 [Verrucomicrobia bacterium]|nr:hypothetical protein [Verrucomicrobiota bacterium]
MKQKSTPPRRRKKPTFSGPERAAGSFHTRVRNKIRRGGKPAPARRRPAKVTPVEPPAVPTNILFPIVGIGASAGGLEALERFLGGVPAGSISNQ